MQVGGFFVLMLLGLDRGGLEPGMLCGVAGEGEPGPATASLVRTSQDIAQGRKREEEQ